MASTPQVPGQLKTVVLFKGSKTNPVGEGHIFEIIKDKEGREGKKTEAYCGITPSEISDWNVTEVDHNDRPVKLPMCKGCVDGWKADPRSPYSLFTLGVAIKVEE